MSQPKGLSFPKDRPPSPEKNFCRPGRPGGQGVQPCDGGPSPQPLASGLEQPQPAQEAKDPLAQVQELLARGVDKKTALAQVAKANKIPKRELYNKLISEEEGINI